MTNGVLRIGGLGFDYRNAGFTFVYDLGRQLIAFDLGFWLLNLIFREFVKVDESGCWKIDIPVPWNEDVAVVADGLWSILSTTEVVNNLFVKQLDKQHHHPIID